MSGVRIALLAAVVLVLAGCGGDGDGASSTTPRQAAPAITGTTLDGRDLSSSNFAGSR